jgi:hypothetical protein
MTLQSTEFIRRFAMHILPKGFVRIRHFGILSSTSKEAAIVLVRKALSAREPQLTEIVVAASVDTNILTQCPCCKKYAMARLLEFDYRGPPKDILSCLTKQPHGTKNKTA